jgi:hypothetical protein
MFQPFGQNAEGKGLDACARDRSPWTYGSSVRGNPLASGGEAGSSDR